MWRGTRSGLSGDRALWLERIIGRIDCFHAVFGLGLRIRRGFHETIRVIAFGEFAVGGFDRFLNAVANLGPFADKSNLPMLPQIHHR